MMKADLKLLLKKAREAHEEATDSQRIPQAREGSSVAKGPRSSGSITPISKNQKVQAQVLRSWEDTTTLPSQRDQAPPSAPIDPSVLYPASSPSSHSPTPAEDHSTLPAKGSILWFDKEKGLAMEIFVNNPNYTLKKMTGVVPKGNL